MNFWGKFFAGSVFICIFAPNYVIMGRDGSGNAWRHRQSRARGGIWGIPRTFNARTLRDEPQFKLDDLYISPFRWKRQYSEDGKVRYVEMERRMAPTGIKMFDAYLQYLAMGRSDMKAFADQHGLRREDIDSMVFILTGMRGVDFRMKFHVRMADEMLRYTSMSVADISMRAGFGSANNLYLTYKREFNLAPGYRRMRIQQPGDVGRYKF